MTFISVCLPRLSGNLLHEAVIWYGPYGAKPQYDPVGPTTGLYRVFRGGAWGSSENGCRLTYRNDDDPGFVYNALGFRLAL